MHGYLTLAIATCSVLIALLTLALIVLGMMFMGLMRRFHVHINTQHKLEKLKNLDGLI